MRGGSRGVLEIRRTCVKRGRVKILETGVSWRKIKAEYIAGGISQRALAEKHGISKATVERRAKKEKWTEKRKASEAKAIEKVSEKKAETVADNAVLLEKIKKGLLERLAGMLEAYPETNVAEMRKKQNGALLIYRMKDIAAIYAALEDKTAAGKNTDIEDLTALTELLRDE